MGQVSGLYGINPEARPIRDVKPFMNHAQKVRKGLGLEDRAWKNRQDSGYFITREQPKQLADHIRGSMDSAGRRKKGLDESSFNELLDDLLNETGFDGRKNYVTCTIPEERKPRRIKTRVDKQNLDHYKRVEAVSRSNRTKTESRWKSLGYESYAEYAYAEIHKY